MYSILYYDLLCLPPLHEKLQTDQLPQLPHRLLQAVPQSCCWLLAPGQPPARSSTLPATVAPPLVARQARLRWRRPGLQEEEQADHCDQAAQLSPRSGQSAAPQVLVWRAGPRQLSAGPPHSLSLTLLPPRQVRVQGDQAAQSAQPEHSPIISQGLSRSEQQKPPPCRPRLPTY